MRTDTLSYHYRYQTTKENFFGALIAEQLKYFKRVDPTIEQLHAGLKINARLMTKIQKHETSNTMMIEEVVPNQRFKMVTNQPAGAIIQMFEFTSDRKGRNVVVYSEQNQFDNNRNQTNFMFIGILYKYFFNRGMKKKMIYLEKIAQQMEPA